MAGGPLVYSIFNLKFLIRKLIIIIIFSMFSLKGDRVRISRKNLWKAGLSQLHIVFILALNKTIIILKT